MELEQAINMLKAIVKNAGNVNQNHLDLSLVSAEQRPKYEEALKFSQEAIKEGKITKEEFQRKLNLK